MEDYLQLDEWEPKYESKPGQKRVSAIYDEMTVGKSARFIGTVGRSGGTKGTGENEGNRVCCRSDKLGQNDGSHDGWKCTHPN